MTVHPFPEAKRSEPPWLFHADFYDAKSNQTVCVIDHAADSPLSQADRLRQRAMILTNAAQAMARDADALDPKMGPPIVTLRLHTHGVFMSMMRGPLIEAEWSTLGARLNQAAELVAQAKREADNP